MSVGDPISGYTVLRENTNVGDYPFGCIYPTELGALRAAQQEAQESGNAVYVLKLVPTHRIKPVLPTVEELK